ncbi:MAG: LytTR family DNA-binding domain-containing protein [Cellvibrio sp.]|uniref:LytR/AlgR family response regulator transcription factor n=1 Tax=Cellvibrio sp. TaxID=1965322 RepID=UPI00271AE956|nr:LytTR family DNA-binding domain-containing protein [Cellvibrio sp.]
MKVLIVEDEPLIAKRLVRLIQDYFSTRLSLLEQLDEVDEALQYLQNTPVDLLLLDLNLYGQDGFEILRRTCAEPCHCIIVSAYADKAIQAFEYGVLDFVAKPFTEERLHKALQRFDQQELIVREMQQLAIKKVGRIQLLAVSEIDYIQADGHYSQVHMKDGSVHLHEKPFERLLSLLPENFQRIHRSFAINTLNILKINIASGGKYSVDTRFSGEIPLARRYYVQLKESLATNKTL